MGTMMIPGRSFFWRIFGIFFLLGASPGLAADADKVVLSIGEAGRIAIERNLGLKVASHSPAIAETDIRKARSIYDPTLSALVDSRGTDLPSLPGSSLVERQHYFDFDASLSQLLPTGATASVSFANLWYKDNLGFAASRYTRPELTLSFSQPLLKGLGREVTERGITTADDAMDASLADWNLQAIGTVASARGRYLALVKARENLSTRRASLALARQVHAENEGRVKSGVLAAYQLQDSTLGVLQRQKDLLDAQRAEKDAADQLLVALHLPPGTLVEDSGIPAPDAFKITEADVLRTAAARRPDMVKARIVVRTAEFNEKVSRNLALPSLSLEGSTGVAGLDPDYHDAVEDMSGGKYPSWSVGLSFSVPLGNSSARADLAASRLKASQARTQLAATEEAALLEVRTALRALESQREQIEVTTQAVTTAETLLASYLKRQQLGLATTKDVLDVEASLTQTRESFAGARADYHSALTDLWKATGELLDREGLQLEGKGPEPRKRKGKP
jgi:outer membrane protein